MVARLAERRGGAFARALVDEAGRLRPSVMALVNDEPPDPAAALAPLRDGDRVTLIPAISGG